MNVRMLGTTYVVPDTEMRNEGIAIECNDQNYFGIILKVLERSEDLQDFMLKMSEGMYSTIPYTVYKIEKWKSYNQ